MVKGCTRSGAWLSGSWRSRWTRWERRIGRCPIRTRSSRRRASTFRPTSVQRSYMYVETRRELKLDKDGRTAEESVKVSESYPGLPGEPRWERLDFRRTDRPVSAEDLAEQDRERTQEGQREWPSACPTSLARSARGSERDWQRAASRARRGRRRHLHRLRHPDDRPRAHRRARHDRVHADAEGRTPTPKTREGELMKHFNVRAWISETDHELVRLEAEAIDNVPFGLGVLARLHKGAQSVVPAPQDQWRGVASGADQLQRQRAGRAAVDAAANAARSEYSGLQEILRRYVVEFRSAQIVGESCRGGPSVPPIPRRV